MNRITKLIYSAFAVVGLTAGALTTNADPGDIFVSAFNTGAIYKITPGGTQSVFAAGLHGPTGLAFDTTGYLFVAEYSFGLITAFTPDGSTRSTFTTQVNRPTGLAFDAAGNLFESDYGSGTINKFAPDASRITFAPGPLRPWGLAFDSTGNIFEADFDTGNIYKFTSGGAQSPFAHGLNSPVGLAFDNAGYLFAGDYTAAIYRFATDATSITFSSGVSFPQGLAFDSAGNLFVASYDTGNIYKIGPGGTPTVFATVAGNPVFIAIQPPAPTPPYAAQVQPPINSDGTSVFNMRRGIVPVKFTLSNNGTPTCTLPPATIHLTRTAGGVTGPVNESDYAGNADTGSNFRISNCQYVYNLNSGALGAGTYRIDILIDNQVVGSATFELR